MGESDNDDSEDGYSEMENVAGVDLENARPIGILGLILTVPLTFYLLVFGLIELNLGLIAFAGIPAIGMGLSYMYSVSEKRWMDSWIMTAGADAEELEHAGEGSTTEDNVKSICRECRTEISPNVKRCPNCGWKPKKRGGLWWGTTAVMSLNPIGWAMGAKGASDNIKASKGVSKEVPANETDGTEEEVEVSSESDPTDTLERLNELRNQGAITEAEFERKKKELLDRI
ncbi:SHOCT domain-containing protein [Halomicroarcula sp. GCM10025324]|uniref:SHOCT domain-containing protein n=1 Tax=Haloarcula TaxID=2237 RepID=UPI0023E7DCB9|nr:SHOCT domain-containing protein [Halomicroarcula sp. ZS-22-S1]